MDISIIPGATVAVIRIKIKTCIDGVDTVWKLCYRPEGTSNYTQITNLTYDSDSIYGGGPLFYDLTGLTENTSYNIKLVVTDAGDDNMVGQYIEKTFTTVSKGNFDFNGREYGEGLRVGNEDDFNELLDWFKECMEAVGYDATITNSITPSSYNTYFSPVIIAYNNYQFDGQSSYGSSIHISSTNKGTLIHEYRHFLGLSSSAVNMGYHGDAGTPPLRRDSNNSYYQTVKNVYSFYIGADENNEGEEEIYIFYGENSLPDTAYYLDFMILKALGLNDINIVY